jgi:hypothetical protein
MLEQPERASGLPRASSLRNDASDCHGEKRNVAPSAKTAPSVRTPRPARRGILSRLVAAIFGGYVAANALALALSALWPGSRADAVLAATLFSFLFHVGAVLWAFAARSARVAWGGLLLLSAFGAALTKLLL